MATRKEFRDRVYLRCGLDTADAMVSLPVVNNAMNDALHFLSTVRDWWWLESTETLATVAGTGTITLASAVRKSRSLAYADGTGELDQVAVSTIDHDRTTAQGKPQVYALYGTQVVLAPIPGAVYSLTHRYLGGEPDLTDDNASPVLPAQYQAALVDYAAYLVLRRTHDSERAAEALAGYQNWERVMTDNARRGVKPMIPRIRDGAAI